MTDSNQPKPASAPATLSAEVSRSWRDFVAQSEALRPDLYRYCRHLTHSPWAADDLVQDTLMRAFVALGCVHQEIRNPRAWLLRIASNLWLNRLRDAREVPTDQAAMVARGQNVAAEDPRDTREAAGAILTRLAPQERAAVVLKDVFDLSLEETAEALSTSVGAVKAALHRGRGKLGDSEPVHEAVVVPAVVDAFCAAFNARDLDRVTSLLLDHAINEFPGLSMEIGAEVAKRGSLAGVLFGDPASDRSGIAPQFRQGLLSSPPRLELRVHRGEPLLLAWFAHQDGEAVRGISRLTVVDDRIAHMRTYLHQPELLAELCAELGVPYRSNGYRFWW